MKIENESEELRELMEMAKEHPLVQRIREEKDASVLAQRTEAAERLANYRQQMEQAISKKQSELGKAEESYRAAKCALDAATQSVTKARGELWSEKNRLNNCMDREQNILKETAYPEIDGAIQFFRRKLDWLRQPGRINRSSAGSENNLTAWKKTKFQFSNIAAIREAIKYCMIAIAELEEMKLHPALDTERIETLKRGIPRIDILQEYRIEGSMPRDNTNELSFLPSDAELSWRFDTLMERAGRLLRRA
jgi:hypothetical protein